MTQKQIIRTSKFLSLVLRHRPERIGASLDAQGWIEVEVLLDKLAQAAFPLTREDLDIVVEQNNKKRFAFNEAKSHIRASQGHSVKIDLAYEPQQPPVVLYHGTAEQHLKNIVREGLKKRKRHHVHLSIERETATSVGNRHGIPKILIVDAQAMAADGYLFYCSENGVWLTDHVPPEYLQLEA